MFDRIMLLSDLSDTIRFAYKPLDRLITRGSRVVLYHAVAGATDRFYLPETMQAQINKAARLKALDALGTYKQELEARGLEVEAVVDLGSTYNELPAAMERYDVDLVVIPTKSQHSIVRGISNSVTARAIRTHAAPVLLINEAFAERADEWKGFNKLMHPVAFGDNHAHSVDAAESLAAMFGSDLHLVHAMRSLELEDFYTDVPEELGWSFQQDEILKRATESLQARADAITSVNVQVDVFETEGVASGLCQYALDHGLGGIVLPGVGQDRTRQMILGSVAEQVIRNAPCPVFVCERPVVAKQAGSVAA